MHTCVDNVYTLVRFVITLILKFNSKIINTIILYILLIKVKDPVTYFFRDILYDDHTKLL